MNGPLEVNQIISYRDMCNIENQETMQRGMNFLMGGDYSVILMSIKPNAPYQDRISEDGQTIFYEGHDLTGDRYKREDQPKATHLGTLTQNGLFAHAIDKGKRAKELPIARVYEKLQPGIWNYRGLFEMADYGFIQRGERKVFEFRLHISDKSVGGRRKAHNLEQTRQIPGRVKLEVYKRDKGMCRKCGSKDNLHFDHILPFSLGGTSVTTENIQLLCARHNLEKSARLIK